VALRLLHEPKLLARERQIEVRVGEVGRQRRGITEENQGGLVLVPVMQHVRQVEARLGVAGFLLERSLEACAGFIRTPCPVVEIAQIDEGRDVFRVEVQGALIRALGVGPGGRVFVQLAAAVEPGLGGLSRFPARPTEGHDARRGDPRREVESKLASVLDPQALDDRPQRPPVRELLMSVTEHQSVVKS
jgi:hypothetical protein